MRREGKIVDVTYCSACGGATKFASILICSDCLADECEKFSSLFEEKDESMDNFELNHAEPTETKA